jgi:hypothetical protein
MSQCLPACYGFKAGITQYPCALLRRYGLYEELRGILNSGYKQKTAFVVRVGVAPSNAEWRMQSVEFGGELDKSHQLNELNRLNGSNGRRSRLERFSCWCPKILATIGRLPETLADRCVVIRMQRKTGSEECERLRNLDGRPLKRCCARSVWDSVEDDANRGSIRQGIPVGGV